MRTDEDADRARGSVTALIASSLLLRDLPDSSLEEREAAGRYVDQSVAAMSDVTRSGVRVAGAAAYGALSVLAGRPYRSLTERRRADLAARLLGLSVPVLGELGRLTRGLGLVAVHERRHADGVAAPAGSPERAR